MDIKVSSTGSTVSMHLRENRSTSIEARGFDKSSDCPRFVALTLGCGEYPNPQVFTAYMGVEQATQMMEALRDAIAKAGCG